MTAPSPSGSAPAGLTPRRPAVADAARILPLMVACDEAVLGTSDATLTELVADLGAPGVDNERGGWLLEDSGGVVGWLWTRVDEAADEVFVDLYSLDVEVLRWLMVQATSYARDLAGEWGRPVTVAAGCYAHDTGYAGVLREGGLEIVRRFWQMRVTLDASARTPPDLPPGVRIRSVDAGDPADLRLLHRLHEDSFADHWNHAARTYEDWFERLDSAAGRDVTQWWIAEVDGFPAGLLIGSSGHAELGEGYVQVLGVAREFRGRGVAKALLYKAFADAADRGWTKVGLGVDSESPTGATRVYESVGMTVDKVILAWQGRESGD